MKIHRIAIRAFRSLYSVNFYPAQFTVLVGPNNSGKSNFADAVDFLSEVYRHGLELAVSRKGGYENIAHRRMRRTKQAVSFETTAQISFAEVPLLRDAMARGQRRRKTQPALTDVLSERPLPDRATISHRFEIKAAGRAIRADFAVSSESLEIAAGWGAEAVPVVRLQRSGDTIVSEVLNEAVQEDPAWARAVRYSGMLGPSGLDYSPLAAEGIGPTDLILTDFSSLVRYFARTIGRTRIYQLNPLECRRPGVMTPNSELEPHGGNLPGLIAYVQNRNPEAWQLTMDSMRNIIPGLSEVRTGFTHDRRLTLQFVEAGVGRPWTSEEVSDGTIQSLALFTVLHDPRAPLVFIEEPENSVHPWIVRAFVDACRNTRKEVVVTTHSPALIDYLKPDEITLVWRDAGRSQLRRLVDLDPQAQELWAKGEASPFEILDSGWIRQNVPEGFA
jgi:predicted ATPase